MNPRLAALAALALGVAAAAPARADTLPAPFINWPAALPAFPAPFTPSVEPDCADGSDACIDRTIAEMNRRLNAVVAPCAHDAVFSVAYLRVTEDVRDFVRAGGFSDARWLNHEDAVFARMYFDAYDDFAAGRMSEVPAAWQVAFGVAKRREVPALANFLLAMNGHINRDFPFLLAGIGITRPDGATRKPDHDAYNARLAQLYEPVLGEVAHRFDATADDFQVGPIDDVAAAQVLESWREGVWRNAERLANARTPEDRAQVAASIESEAEAIAGLIVELFRYRGDQTSAARDAHCARFGGQDPAAGTARLLPRRGRLVVGRGRLVSVPLACPGGASACRGTIQILRRGRVIGASRELFLMPGGRATAKAPVPRSVARALRRGRSRAAVVVFRRTGVTGEGHAARRAVRLVLRRSRR
jgi:hypothetical protein